MLVTFSSAAHADITLFGNDALQLIRMMGHTEVVPGALLADDVPAALATLTQAIKANPDALSGSGESKDEDDQVLLSTRAFALLQLLRAAASSKADVLWHH